MACSKILRNTNVDGTQRVAMTKERKDGAAKWDFLLAQRNVHGVKQAQMGKTAVLNARDTSLWGRRITRCSRQRSPSRPYAIKCLLLLSTARFLPAEGKGGESIYEKFKGQTQQCTKIRYRE